MYGDYKDKVDRKSNRTSMVFERSPMLTRDKIFRLRGKALNINSKEVKISKARLKLDKYHINSTNYLKNLKKALKNDSRESIFALHLLLQMYNFCYDKCINFMQNVFDL